MKYLDEYRNSEIAAGLTRKIGEVVTKPWVLMEVCGGQTHSIVRYGIDRMVPSAIELVHGPGCPVCVTSLEMIDRAHAIASRPEVIFTSFGDMLRVPGSRLRPAHAQEPRRRRASGLLAAGRGQDRAREPGSQGGVLRHRIRNHGAGQRDGDPSGQAAGQSGTSRCWSRTYWCRRRWPRSFRLPVIVCRRFLGPGHVCAVMGYREYESLCEQYRVPIVITGFEPIDLLEGILMAVRQLEDGRAEVENQYVRAVSREGNRAARDLIFEVFEVGDRKWRGVGSIPKSRLQNQLRIPRPRRGKDLRSRPYRYPRVVRVHQRPDPAGRQKALRLPGVRPPMHAANSAGRDDGFGGGRVRRLLSVWALSRHQG